MKDFSKIFFGEEQDERQLADVAGFDLLDHESKERVSVEKLLLIEGFHQSKSVAKREGQKLSNNGGGDLWRGSKGLHLRVSELLGPFGSELTIDQDPLRFGSTAGFRAEVGSRLWENDLVELLPNEFLDNRRPITCVLSDGSY